VFLLALGGVLFFHFARDLSYEDRAAKKGLLHNGSGFNLKLAKEPTETVAEIFQDAIKEATFADDKESKAAILQLASTHASQVVELVKADAPSAETNIALNRNILISSVVARVGIVAVIGYLIRILLASYRYNLRLATFNSSRAYSLMLIPTSKHPDSLREFATVLGADAVDFEKVDEPTISGTAEKLTAVADK
jgi:hypothetical protein